MANKLNVNLNTNYYIIQRPSYSFHETKHTKRVFRKIQIKVNFTCNESAPKKHNTELPNPF